MATPPIRFRYVVGMPQPFNGLIRNRSRFSARRKNSPNLRTAALLPNTEETSPLGRRTPCRRTASSAYTHTQWRNGLERGAIALELMGSMMGCLGEHNGRKGPSI